MRLELPTAVYSRRSRFTGIAVDNVRITLRNIGYGKGAPGLDRLAQIRRWRPKLSQYETRYMPMWVLECHHCNADFNESKISDSGFATFNIPVKPEMPSELCCPNCGEKSTYYRNDFVYRA